MSLFVEFIWTHLGILIIRKKDILILGIGPTQRLDNTALSVEAQYSINFSKSNKKFCFMSLLFGSNRFLFVNATKIYLFKAKDFKIKKNISYVRKYLRRSQLVT